MDHRYCVGGNNDSMSWTSRTVEFVGCEQVYGVLDFERKPETRLQILLLEKWILKNELHNATTISGVITWRERYILLRLDGDCCQLNDSPGLENP